MQFNKSIKDGHIHLTPKTGKYSHIIIWLHGLGDCPESYVDFFTEELSLPKNISTKIILLRAPSNPFPSWFDITSFPIEDEKCFDFNSAKNAAKKIESIINEEVKAIDGKYQNVFVGGFSQGACLSLYLGLSLPHLIGGVICCSGVLFPQTKILESNKNLKVFVGHGEKDMMISFAAHKLSMEMVKNFNGIEKHYYKNMEHSICQQELVDITNFLQKYLV